MGTVYEESLALHKKHKGKLEIHAKVAVESLDDLALAYSPGVAEPCREIEKDEETAYLYTNKGNTIAIVTDGSAVLGLGDIGAKAALPVMEGKAVLFKRFANIDAIPLCVDVHDVDGMVTFIKALEPTFAGILMEDIGAPKCVAIERTLKEEMGIPVFHDDQHGTAIITIAALANMLRMTGKKKEELKVVTCGVGAAGSSIIKMMYDFGIRQIEAFSSKGQMRQENKEQYDFLKRELLQYVNLDGKHFETMADAMVGADVFIGVSAPGLVTKEMVASMNEQSCVLAMANPTPEIMPEDALDAGALVVGTGRSDYPNQVNNVLAFPGLFRGVLDVNATKISEGMKMAAAMALANLISDDELTPDHIIPTVFDSRVAPAVAKAVAACAIKEGNIR